MSLKEENSTHMPIKSPVESALSTTSDSTERQLNQEPSVPQPAQTEANEEAKRPLSENTKVSNDLAIDGDTKPPDMKPLDSETKVTPAEAANDSETDVKTAEDGNSTEQQSNHRGHHHNNYHHHHHHHHHRHHANNAQADGKDEEHTERDDKKSENALVISESSEPASKRRDIRPKVNMTNIHPIIQELYPHRKHLGTIVYNPTTTWSTLQIDQLHGLSEHDLQRLVDIRDSYNERLKEPFAAAEECYIPVIPFLTDAYINCLLEVKIPYRFIKQFIEEFTLGKTQKKRELWGGASGIYTDDSDILAVLCHLGLFDDALDLTPNNSDWRPTDVVKPLRVATDSNGVQLLDLSVTLLMLPALRQYDGFYSNGINSRTWNADNVHDGLSICVYSVKWETMQASVADRNVQKRSLLELEAEKENRKRVIESGGGWKFNRKFYDQVKDSLRNKRTLGNAGDQLTIPPRDE